MKRISKTIAGSLLLASLLLSTVQAQEAPPARFASGARLGVSETVLTVSLKPMDAALNFTVTIQREGTPAPQQTKTAQAALNQTVSVEMTGLVPNAVYFLTMKGEVAEAAMQTKFSTSQKTYKFTATTGNTGHQYVTSAGGTSVNTNTAPGQQSNVLTNTAPGQSAVTMVDAPLSIKLKNPLKVDTVQDAIKLFMDAVIKIAIPFIVVFFIWAGIQFILAQGSEEKLRKAKKRFWYTVIGTLLILGAWAITDAIVGTVNSLAG